MTSLPTTSNVKPETTNNDLPAIPLYDRLVLWMFLLGFVLFGLILLGDLFTGLLR
jgi:hypothetical protein